MRIMIGHTEKLDNGGFAKVEIELDETDLLRLAGEFGLEPEEIQSLRTYSKFTSLEQYAQAMALYSLARQYPDVYKTPEVAAAAAEHIAASKSAMGVVG